MRFSLLSLVILGVLVFQTFCGFRRTYNWWPFLAYPMYAEAHFEGERIKVTYRVYAITADGVRHYLEPEADLKLNFWRYDGLGRTLTEGRFKDNAALLGDIRRLYPTVQRVEVEDYPMVITRDGPVPAPIKVVQTVSRGVIDEVTK